MPPGSDSKEIAVLQTKVQSLQEFTRERFEQIETALERLQEVMDRTAMTAVTQTLYRQQVKSIDRAHARLDDHAMKIARYEQVTRLLNALWIVVSAIIVSVLIALATGKAHIVWQ